MSGPTGHGGSSPRRNIRQLAGIFVAISSAYFLSEFFRISHAVIGPDLMREFEFTVGGLSLLTSVFFFAFAAQQLPNGFLFDRFGPRVTIPCLLLVAIGGGFLFATADSLFALSVARAFMGIGWAVAFMGGLITLARWVPTDRYALAVAAMIFVGTLGNLFATSPWAALVDAIGWRTAMVATNCVAAVSAVLVLLVVRDAPAGHAYHHRSHETFTVMMRGLGEVVQIPGWRYIWWMNFHNYAVVITVLALLGPTYLTDIHDLDLAERGQVLLIMTLAMGAGSLCAGPLDRFLDTRKEIVSLGSFATAMVHATLALVPNLALWQATTLFALLGFVGANGVVNLAHARAVLPDYLIGRGMVTMALAAFAGSAVLQMVAGFIVDAFPAAAGGGAPEIAYRAAFGFVAVSMFLAVLYHRRVKDAKPSSDRTAG